MAGARDTIRHPPFSCWAVLHGQSWAKRHQPLASTVALPLLAAPRADAPGKSSGTVHSVARLFERTHRLSLASVLTPTRTRTANHWHKHRANTDRSRPVRRPNIDQPALSAAKQPSRPTRSVEPVLHASPPRLMHSQQAREHCLAASQSPKWPPRTLLSVIVSLSSAKESSNPTTVQRETL